MKNNQCLLVLNKFKNTNCSKSVCECENMEVNCGNLTAKGRSNTHLERGGVREGHSGGWILHSEP